MVNDMKNHFAEGESLLAKIYGLYTIKTNKFSPVDIIIMKNTNRRINKKNQTITFDLKGSIKNRIVKFSKSENGWWMRER